MPRILATVLLFVAVGELQADEAVRRPIQPILPPGFQLVITTQPAFGGNSIPGQSVTASSHGLTVTAQSEQRVFPQSGPLSFKVTLKNDSKQNLTVANTEQLGGAVKLVVSNQQTRAQWTTQSSPIRRGTSTVIKPGDSITRYAVAKTNFVVRPVPVPFPKPRPVPFPQPRKADQVIRPIVVQPTLPCGSGLNSARLFFQFSINNEIAKLATPPMSIRVAGSVVFPPRPQPPIIAGPLTREQAITRAAAAAEQSLSQHYQARPPIRPDKVGAWIVNPAKTATVVKQGAGWTVSWTSFPKSGFSYNVAVTVDGSGRTSIQEIFAGHSRKR